MPKEVPNKRYTPEFKVMVIETMRKEGLSYCEAARQFEVPLDTRIASWERIYLTEGAEGFRIERRGCGNKGHYGYRRITSELRHRGFSLNHKPVLSMVREMLHEAFAKIPDGTNLILHSDQGWQYQHKQYQSMLKAKGIQQSMSRKGNCLDNAVIENFFGLLKSELLYLQDFQSMEHFKTELFDYLDYYNNRRSKAKLKGLPSAIHRLQALSAA